MPVFRDISLGADGDLLVVAGDLVLTQDLDAFAQDLDAQLSLVKGEWFLAPEDGVDYFGKILKRNPNMADVRAEFRAAALGTLGAVEVQALALDFDPKLRKLTGSITVKCDLGVVTRAIDSGV